MPLELVLAKFSHISNGGNKLDITCVERANKINLTKGNKIDLIKMQQDRFNQNATLRSVL